MLFKFKKILMAALAVSGLVFTAVSYANGGSFTNDDSYSNPWMVRLRALYIDPYASSSQLPIINGEVTHISSEVIPELDISYFFNHYLAAELILGTSRHSVEATGTTLGNVDLGHVNLLPPTLTLQYHFLPNSMINPYVGAGINYTYFYNVDNGPTATSIKYSNSFGPALQAGVDVFLDKHWAINFDVKKIFIESSVHVVALGTVLDTQVKINPMVYGVGIGYHF